MEEEKKYLNYQGLQTYHENLLAVLENSEQATAEALDDLDDRLKVIEDKSPYSKSEIDLLLTPITDKLESIEEFAEVNVQSDWNQTDTNADDYIKNKPTSMPASDVSAWAKASSKPTYTASEVGAIPTSAKGAASGVAELDTTGKVPASQLPSYVDDVLEYANKASFPTTGETGKIYVDKATNLTWRWGGSAYIEISPSIALGETSSTAYAGDKGKALADKLATIAEGAEVNVQSDWNATSGDAFIKNKPTIPAAVTESTVSGWGFTKNAGTITGIKMNGSSKGTSGTVDLGTVITSHQDISGKVDKTTTVNGHALSSNVSVTKSDVGLGNVGNFKAVSTVASQGLTDTEKSNARANIGAGTSSSDTKNTTGTTNKTGTKMFLAAATEQGANPVTYSNSNCYIGTDNCLYSGGTKVLTSHQSLSNYYTKTQVDALTRHTRLTNFDLNVLKQAVADQNLEKYGLRVGDQKTINGYTYVIADLNTMKGTSTPYRLTLNHVGLIVIPHIRHAWNSSGRTDTGANSRGAGYKNCDLHDYLKNTVLPHAKNDLGAANLLAHSKLLTNAVNTTGYNRFGKAEGCSSSWEWASDLYISALSEVLVYGSIVWSSSGYDTGEACRLLEVFKKYSHTEIFGSEYPWLRDIVSVTSASSADNDGHATYWAVSNSDFWVAGLLLFH